MSPVRREQLLAESLEDFLLRRTRGERPDPNDYAESLAEAYDEFLEILDVETLLDELLEPPPDQVLPRDFGDYTLLREIGRGVFGIVYEALDRELGRHVALKVLKRGFEGEGVGALARFRNEAKTLARVRHPHIVEIYRAGQVDGQPFYAMALVEGTPLSRLANSEERLSPREVCRGLAGVADALQTLHDNHIFHRDVKPSNIIVAADGRMVLSDFGLARSPESSVLTRSGQAIGTPLYMSPEQIRGTPRDVDGRSDVYSLGATLYEALTGQHVFPASAWEVLVRMALAERPVPIRRLAPEVPADCAGIAMKALEKRKEDRYQTAGELRDDLMAFAEGKAVRGRPVSALRHTLRRVRRPRYVIAAAAVLVAAVGVWYWLGTRPAKLVLSTAFPVEVWVDGALRATSPATVEVERGTYRVELRHEKLLPERHTITLGAGQSLPWLYLPLRALDPNDPETLELLAQAVGLEALGLDELSRVEVRDPDARSRAVFPAGRVRLADLGDYLVEAGDPAPPEGTRLVFRRDGETLYESPQAVGSFPTQGPIPDRVRAVLRPGDAVSWGYEDADGGVWQTFRVVADPSGLEALIERLEDQLVHQDDAVKAFFRAQALMQHDLPYAAYVAARKEVDVKRPSAAGLGPWVAMQQALGALGLAESELWSEADKVIWYGFPRDVVEAWFGAEGDGR